MNRAAWTLFVLALAWHVAWASTLPLPVDWDPQYYRAVAQHIAAGEGATTGAVWSWMLAPASLPFPADLHWMPGPSRVLVPGLWLWPAHGDQAVTVLLAALLAPLAWALGRRLDHDSALTAGLAAAGGWFWVRYLSTPDSLALYGAVAGLAFWALATKRLGWTTALSAAAALVRSDGFLLGPCLALGARGPWRWALLVAGPLMQGLWSLRNRWVFGADALTARLVSLNAGRYDDLLLGHTDPLPLAERLGLFLGEIPVAYGFFWLALLPLPALVEAWWRRDTPWVRSVLAYAVLLPTVSHLLAPAVASSGTLFRSGAALAAPAMALWAAGVWRLGRYSHARRDYPRAFLPVTLLVGLLSATGVLAWLRVGMDPDPTADCAAVADVPADAVLFASDPLALEACGRRSVLLPRDTTAEDLAVWQQRYDITWALVAPPDETTRWWAAKAEDLPALLPGWRRVGERLYRAD